MSQNGNNARGLNGLLNGKANLNQQIESSLSAASQAMEILKVSMAFKNDLDSAVAKFNKSLMALQADNAGAGQGNNGNNGKSHLVVDDDGESVSDIIAEYNRRKAAGGE